MKKFLFLFSVFLFVLSSVGFASALPLINGSFETGDFTGWATSAWNGGSTEVVTTSTHDTAGVYNATDGNYLAELQSDSLLYQSASWAAGETLSFDWAFLTDDWDKWFFADDYSIFQIRDSVTDDVILNITLADVNSVGSQGASSWQSYSFKFTSDVVATIGFGVINGAGPIPDFLDSKLLIDNILSTPPSTSSMPVPEPSLMLLLGVGGLFGMFGVKKERA